MMKARIAEAQSYGKWADEWVEHPTPTMNEPHKAVSWLTAKASIDEDRMADMFLDAGIAMLTPDDVHHHRTQNVLDQRGRSLQAAWTRHPERFVRGIPKPDPLPEAVWINPPVTPTTGDTAQ